MKTLFSVFLLLVVFACCSHTYTITISSPTEGVTPSKLLVSYTNDLDHKTHLLKWRTPFDDLETLYSFVVRKDGEKMEYKGPIALRTGPFVYDFLEFHSNQTRSSIVDLAEAFDFPTVGRYQIQLVSEVLSSVSTESNRISIMVTKPSMVEMVTSPMVPYISFRNCDNSHQNIIIPAWAEFGVATGLMKSTVVMNPQNDPLYKTWFGVYNGNRFSTVSTCIYNLDDDFHTNGKEFYCNPSGCSPGVVAYVSSGAPNTIHVCQLYFQLTNRDHIFVIVHEELHFQAICGAPDYVYGRQGSLNLAITNPNNAVRNSDNYRFYGEDLYYARDSVQ